MALTIRTRLTLWYSLVLFVTLAATAVALVIVHSRLGLSRVDRGLAREIRLNNRATDVSNLVWFEALYREWASNSAKVFAAAQP